MSRKPKDEDPHQDAVYDWEGEWPEWNLSVLPFKTCRAMIETACAHYGVKPPKIMCHKTRAISWCYPSRAEISLRHRDHLNGPTALHEAAHFIVWTLFGERPQDHGATFLGVLMWLLEKAAVAPVEALHASARAKGLKWRHLPPTLLETARAQLHDGVRVPR